MPGRRSRYTELPPPPALRGLVACSWTQRVEPSPSPYRQRVLPDGCADIVWLPGTGLALVGPATIAEIADLPAGLVTLGVRFRPGAATNALGVPASELRDDTVPLSALWGADADRLAEQVAGASSPALALAALAAAIARRRPADPDPLVGAAARALDKPDARVRELGGALGLSERQLRRRFDDAVGYGPKTFARILRLHRFLRRAEHTDAPRTLGFLAAEAGYADQAHLTRDCQRLSGLTPSSLLAIRAAAA